MHRMFVVVVTLLFSGTMLSPASAAASVATLYVTNGDSRTISAFTITDTGELQALGAPLETGARPRGIVLSPDGDMAYVVNSDAQQVSSYRVGQGGELTLVGTVPTIGSGFGIAISPDGSTVFVTNLDEATLSVFAVRYSDGALEPVGAPVPVGDGLTPTRGVAASPDGRFVFVGTGIPNDPTPGTLATFALRPNHALQLL